MEESRTQLPGARWDRVAVELQTLRRAAGEPSFAEIARRVSQQRLAAGVDEHAARVARTTVYDVFRTGRARVNVPLVREVVRSLGADPGLVDGWLNEEPAARPGSAAVVDQQVAPVAPSAPAAPAAPAAPPRSRVVLLLVACVLLNLLGRVVVDALQLPVFLDMTGTAIAAIALGPWHGAAVGLTTNLAGSVTSGALSVPFALVNITGALAWGYGVRRLGLGRTLPRFLALNVGVAAACTLVAVPILATLFPPGDTNHGQDFISGTLMAMTDVLVLAVGLSNLLVSIGDKVISGFVALVAVSALPPAYRRGAALPLVAPPAVPDAAPGAAARQP